MAEAVSSEFDSLSLQCHFWNHNELSTFFSCITWLGYGIITVLETSQQRSYNSRRNEILAKYLLWGIPSDFRGLPPIFCFVWYSPNYIYFFIFKQCSNLKESTILFFSPIEDDSFFHQDGSFKKEWLSSLWQPSKKFTAGERRRLINKK